MENNISKKIKTILSQIKNISSQYDDFFESLSELDIPFRDALIENIYREILKKNDFYLEANEQEVKKPKKFEKEQYIERILSQIKKYPAKKRKYLQEFLDLSEEISNSDKKVILNSFLKLEKKELKDQMNGLMNTFKFSL